MTANKPEVVAWRWRKPIVNDHGETVGGVWELGGAPAFLPWWTNEPLVRLSDYEALRAECDTLVEALESAKNLIANHSGEMLPDEYAGDQIEQIDAALAAHRKQQEGEA